MPTLYLTEQGSTLRKEGQRLEVTKGEQVLLSVPALRVERIMVLGYVQITAQAMGFLLGQGIDVSYLSMSGRLKGRLVAAESKNIVLRMAQFERALDAAFKLELARSIVFGKIRNQRAVIQRHLRNHPGAPGLEQTEQTLDRSTTLLDNQGTVAELMGVEGTGSATYFRAFGRMVRGEFSFRRRSRRPPKDPVNALLSLGYTLVGNELMAILASIGLDPYLGFLHGVGYGRPSLSLDLLEEFRAPVVDRLTLNLINLQKLEPADFVPDADGGVLLRPEALKQYLQEYEKALNSPFNHPATGERVTFRRVFALQAHALARALRERGRYEPFCPK